MASWWLAVWALLVSSGHWTQARIIAPPELALDVRPEPTGGYLAICLIVKNQADDIAWWANYHIAMGVSRIYVHDNNSTRPLSTELDDLIADGFVQYSWFDHYPTQPEPPQFWVYNRCISRYGHKHRFMAFIDTDEFLVLQDHRYKRLPDFLRNYEPFGGISVNEVLFGSNGLHQRPANPVVFQNYEMCMDMEGEKDYFVKVIANTGHVLRSLNPHHFEFQEGFSSVLEDRSPFNSHASRQHHHEHISLYHFVLKSREDFANKAMRGGAAGKFRDWGFFDDIDNQAVVNCSEALLGPQWPIQTEDERPPGIQPARHHRTLLM